MKKILMRYFLVLAVACLTSPLGIANTQDMAKKVLSQTSNSPFCEAGYAGANPFEIQKYQQPETAKSPCKGYKSLIECYRSKYKTQGN